MAPQSIYHNCGTPSLRPNIRSTQKSLEMKLETEEQYKDSTFTDEET